MSKHQTVIYILLFKTILSNCGLPSILLIKVFSHAGLYEMHICFLAHVCQCY